MWEEVGYVGGRCIGGRTWELCTEEQVGDPQQKGVGGRHIRRGKWKVLTGEQVAVMYGGSRWQVCAWGVGGRYVYSGGRQVGDVMGGT